MTIWILAVVLLASLAGLGYRQGVIRVGASLVGIILGALLAVPIGNLIRPLFSTVGLKHPLVLWLVPPFLVFCLILTGCKIAGMAFHKKVDLHYKYHGELRLALWERVSRRTGLCLGLVNGLAYLVLLSFVIYAVSYWTVQMSGSGSESWTLRLVNRLGKDLEPTGMAKVARSVDRLNPAYYDAADAVGDIYHTPALGARVAGYPGFLSIGERAEFQELASDAEFKNLWQKRSSLAELTRNPKVNAVLKNPALMKSLWAELAPNIQDFNNYLRTGESAKFGAEKILGRWTFDVNGGIAMFRKLRPTASSGDIARRRAWMNLAFANASFVATPQQEAIVKNVPARGTTPGQTQSLQGQWKGSEGNYQVTLTVDGQPQEVPVEIQGNRLSIPLMDGLAFVRAN